LGRLKRSFLRGILLKTSHKDRRNGLTGKKMRGGLLEVSAPYLTLPRISEPIFYINKELSAGLKRWLLA